MDVIAHFITALVLGYVGFLWFSPRVVITIMVLLIVGKECFDYARLWSYNANMLWDFAAGILGLLVAVFLSKKVFIAWIH